MGRHALYQNRSVIPTWLRWKPSRLIKSLGIDAAIVRQQFDQLASFCTGRGDGPLHQLLADAATAALGGDANVLDQGARGALRAQSRQNAELQAADHRAFAILGDHKLDVGIAIDPFERRKIG